MNIHIWDSIGHGYAEVPGKISRHSNPSDFEAAWKVSTALAIHTSEECPQESIRQIALRALTVSSGPLLLFSGASATNGAQVMSDLPPKFKSRVRAFTASELVTRLRRVQSEEVDHQRILLAPNRIEVAVAALNALQAFAWMVELSMSHEEIEEAKDAALERFLIVTEQAGAGPLDPFASAGRPSTLTATTIDRWMGESFTDYGAYNARMEAIRDALLSWVASE